MVVGTVPPNSGTHSCRPPCGAASECNMMKQVVAAVVPLCQLHAILRGALLLKQHGGPICLFPLPQLIKLLCHVRSTRAGLFITALLKYAGYYRVDFQLENSSHHKLLLLALMVVSEANPSESYTCPTVQHKPSSAASCTDLPGSPFTLKFISNARPANRILQSVKCQNPNTCCAQFS